MSEAKSTIISLAGYRKRLDKNPKPLAAPVARRSSMLAEIVVSDVLKSYRIASRGDASRASIAAIFTSLEPDDLGTKYAVRADGSIDRLLIG